MAELKSCPICSGGKVLYQSTTHTKLYLDTFGESRVLITECNPCPPYANCSMKNISANSAFIVKYCPECGRDLNTRTPKERGADKPKITCLNCKHLMFSDMYGECNKQLKIVNPSDTCEYAEPKERGGEK